MMEIWWTVDLPKKNTKKQFCPHNESWTDGRFFKEKKKGAKMEKVSDNDCGY